MLQERGPKFCIRNHFGSVGSTCVNYKSSRYYIFYAVFRHYFMVPSIHSTLSDNNLNIEKLNAMLFFMSFAITYLLRKNWLVFWADLETKIVTTIIFLYDSNQFRNIFWASLDKMRLMKELLHNWRMFCVRP